MTPNITNRRNHQSSTLTKTQRRAACIILSICILLWIITSHFSSSPTTSTSATSSSSSSYHASSSSTTATTTTTTSCLVSHGTYSGSIYTKPHETLHNKCLVESPWMRLAQHSVQLQPSSSSGAKGGNDGNGNGGGKVIDDWLWIDYHDRINVLVEAPATDNRTTTITSDRDEISFLILTQTKYALPFQSLAIAGGIIEPNEEALDAAQREVREELGVVCKEWKVLGNRFRTDVNRGMGWVHPYLARDCSYSSNTADNNQNKNDATDNPNDKEEVGGHDTEKQLVRIMKFSNVKRAVMDGRFVEVQWSNTVALAMLHLSLE